jgi:hypothetical protein
MPKVEQHMQHQDYQQQQQQQHYQMSQHMRQQQRLDDDEPMSPRFNHRQQVNNNALQYHEQDEQMLIGEENAPQPAQTVEIDLKCAEKVTDSDVESNCDNSEEKANYKAKVREQVCE